MKLKRLVRTIRTKQSFESSSSSTTRVKPRLSLKSPLTRLVAAQIGKGRPAYLLQQFASAAVEEAGGDNVSGSIRWAAKIGKSGKNLNHAEAAFQRALSRSDEAIIQCPLTYVTIPIIDATKVRKTRKKKPFKGKAKAKAKARTKKQGAAPPAIVYKQWPVMTPELMRDAVIGAGATHLLIGDLDWLDFWEKVKSEPWGSSHPIHDWPDADRASAVGIAFHGDEGQGKKNKNLLILSWSSMGVNKRSTHCRFPFAVIRSSLFAYEGVRNLTLDHLQKEFVRTLNQCTQGSVKLVYIAGMGDWKWKREWLMETRHYGRATKKVDGDGGLICRRCLCGTADKPWVDMSERFNNEADLERAAQTSCGQIALKDLWGWHPSMECPDLLHSYWLGTIRDAAGSLLCDLVEHAPWCAEFDTWDDKLHCAVLDAREWCKENKLAPSNIDDWSLCRLGVDAISYDFPQSCNHGFSNRVMMAYLADRLKDATNAGTEALEKQAVNAWAGHQFGMALDCAPMFLSEGQAEQIIELGMLYVESLTYLATAAHEKLAPRYKLRPKFHSVHCETLCRLKNGARMNPRFYSCWNAEDYIGRIANIGKGSCHVQSLSKRVLQRALLQLNVFLMEAT